MRRRKPDPSDPKLAVAYVRVSTTRQELGPEAQRVAIGAWAEREGVQIASWHTDKISGSRIHEDRPALGEAFRALVECRAGILVVTSRDRLARDVVIAATIQREVESRGARVVSADGAGNGDTDSDAFMRNILNAVAEHERALIRGRVKRGLEVVRARGKRTGGVPYGFSADGDGMLCPHAMEQATIALARTLRRDGMTLREIAAHLDASGCLNRLGKRFAASSIERMIRSVRVVRTEGDLTCK